MRIKSAIIAVCIAFMPFPPAIEFAPTFNGDVYTTIGDCIYDGDGNVTECGIQVG